MHAEHPVDTAAAVDVDDRSYDELIDLAGWSTAQAGAPVDDLTSQATSLLHREARLLDQRRFVEWLDLWTGDGLLWVPVAPDGGDPRRDLSIELADLTHLHERVARLGSPTAHANVPPARTVRIVGDVEAWPHGDGLRARSCVVIWVERGHEQLAFPATQVHELVGTGDGGGVGRIRRKIIFLLASTSPLASSHSAAVL